MADKRQVIYESKMAEFAKRLAKAENKLLQEIGIGVSGQAIMLAPIDTGNLANSINYKVNAQAKAVTIGTPVEYGIYQELGTRKMSAKPYLAPAFAAMMPDIREKARKEYGEIDGPGDISVRYPDDPPS